MPRRKSACSSRGKKSAISEIICDEFEYDNNIDIALIPDPNTSDIEDESEGDGTDSDNESENCDVGDKVMSYRQVYNNYSNNQKYLEKDHQYSWADTEKVYPDAISNEYLLKESDQKAIYNSSPVEIFEMFFSNSMKEYIVQASQENRLKISLHELEVFIGIIILTTFNERTCERDYWSTDPLLECPIVRSAMSRDNFLRIKSGLKCSKNSDKNLNDPAWRVRTLLEMFKANIKRFGFFQTALSQDEMMIKYFGRLIFKQFIRNKPVRFGIKMWALCGADGFLFECDIYCGKNSNNDGLLSKCALGSRVILKLSEKLLLSTSRKKLAQYHTYFDNYFTSADLLVHLNNVGLKATGIVRKDRMKEKNSLGKNVARGTYNVKSEVNSGMNYITLMDSKEVSLLSTAAGVTPLKEVKRYSKENKSKIDIPMPNAFSMYNKYMGGVDIHDQYCSSLLPSFRSKKWTWPVLLRLIQSSVTNAVLLSNAVRKNEKKASGKQFAMDIARQYLKKGKSGDLNTHQLTTIKKRKYCSQEKCESRTFLFCEKCNNSFCKTCFEIIHSK